MTFERWLRPALIVLIFSLPIVLPFFVSTSLLFPYITGKNYFFRVITELIFGGYIALAIANPKYRPKFSSLYFAVLAFVVVMGLAAVFGENFWKSFWSNNERMEGFVTIIHLGLFFVVVSQIFSSKNWRNFLQTSLGVSVIVAIQSFIELGQNVDRVDGSFGNPTYLGGYALLHVFFALFFVTRELFVLQEGKQLRREHTIMYSVIALLNVVILYFSGTRGALVGLAGGLTTVAIIFAIRERKNKILRNFAIGLLIVELLTTIFFVSIHNTEFAKNHHTLARFSDLITAVVTLDFKLIAEIGDARFNIWQVALEGVKERPILGWGQENFSYVFSKYYSPGLYSQEQWFDRTHNVFLDWLIAGGVLGLLSYLSLFAAFLYILWQNKEMRFTTIEQGILTGIIVAYFIHNLFVFDNLVSYVFIFTLLSYTVIKKVENENFEKKPYVIPGGNIVPATILILALLAPIAINAQGIRASGNIIDGLVKTGGALQAGPNDPRSSTLMQSGLKEFENVFASDSWNDVEAVEQLTGYSVQVYASGFDDQIKKNFVDMNIREYKEVLEESPDARSYLFYGNFLTRIGRLEEAEDNIKKAIELSPSKQSMFLSLAQVYFLEKKEKEALETYKKAYELDPSFDEPKIFYALALSRAGQKVEANKLLATVNEGALLQDKFLPAFATLGRYDLAVKVLEKKVSGNPKNVDVRVSLAAAYLENGERAKSIATLEGIVATNPEYSVQINKLIAEIRAGRNPIDN